MNIKQTIISATVALTMVALVAPASVGAITAAELQAKIADLQLQLNMLSAPSGSMPAACVGVVPLLRNLKVGSVGSDVKCVQAGMNALGYTVSASGAGSMGMETTYFGAKTLVAVNRWQKAMLGTSATQFGPMSRAEFNAWASGTTPAPTPTPTPTPTPVPTGAGLSVMLASNNPAAGTIVDGQALAPLAALTFTNGDNAEVKVTGLKLKRIGVSADASLTNVYLFKGAERLTDGAAVSSTMINFNNTTGIFTVPSMGSVTILVLANVDGTSGETVGVQVSSSADVTTNASSVKGTYPISGNLMTIATGTLAGVNFNATTTPAASSVDPQDGYTAWQNSVTVTTRAVDMTRISFRKTGSTNDTDLKNFKLYVDGVQVGTTAQLAKNANGDSYVNFDLTGTPKRLEAGTRVVKVLTDIVGGSSLTFTMHLWSVADATFVDTQYNANVLAQSASATFSKRSTGEQTINSGTITITKMTTSPSGNIVDGASAATLAKFELKAAGESVKIDTLYVSANVNTSGVSGLRNGMLLANGVQIGSTTTLYDPADSSFDYTTYNLGSSLIVVPGSPVTLEVKADIYDTGTSDTTNSIVSGSTIQVTIEGASTNNNGTGQVSATTLDVPAADISANTLTVKQGTLTLSKYTAYTNRNAVPPLTALKLSHFTLTNDTVEAINLNDIEVNLNYVSGSTTNLYVTYGAQTTSVKPTVAAANNWSVNYNLPAGTTIDIQVFGDIASTALGVATSGVYITGTTASSAVAVTAGTDADATTGQTITFTTGSVTTSVDAATPLNQAVAGTQSVVAGKFKFSAANDSFTLKETRFTIAGTDATSAVVSSLTLKDGSTVLATVPYDGTNDYFNITGLTLPIPANTSKVLTAELNLATPYTDGTTVTTGKAATITLSYAKVANSQGTETEPTTARVANYTYVYKSIPTFTAVTPSAQGATLASGGTVEIYKVNVAAASQGPVAMKQLKFTVTVTDAGATDVDPYLDTFKFFRGSTDITSAVTIQNTDPLLSSLESTTKNVSGSSTTVIVTFDTEEGVAAGANQTYTLKAKATNFVSSTTGNDSVAVLMPADTVPSDGTADGGAAGANQTGFYLDATSNTARQTLATSAAGLGTGTGSTSNGNVIWSDYAAQTHDYTYTGSSADWFNGYLLNNLPLDTISSVTP